MPDKNIASTKQSVDTKFETRPDGAVVKTITTTTVKQYDDGSSSTETSIKIITDKAASNKRKTPVPQSTTDDRRGTNKERKSKTSEVADSLAKLAVTKKLDTQDQHSKHVPEYKNDATKVQKAPLRDFEMQALDAHNLYRKNHNVPPLVLNDDLCKQSQIWANMLADEDDKSNGVVKNFFSKCSYTEYGENVRYCKNSLATGKKAVDSWYSQVERHNFDRDFQKTTSSFAQIVWKSTKELGVAKAICKRGGIYVVANYRPAFVSTKFIENIPKPNKPLQFFDHLNKAALPRCMVTTDRKFLTDALKAFNNCRKKHHTPSLVLSDDLCQVAQAQANKLAEKSTMNSSDVPYMDYYGESRYGSSNSEVSGDRAVTKWYAEVDKYKFEENVEYQSGTGNFTYVVWKGTKEVGIAKAISVKDYTYVVAIYNPRGNVKGEYARNVLNPWSQMPVAKLVNSFQHK